MVAKQDAEAQAPGSMPSFRQAGRERSIRWVYLWLLFSSLLAVPWMASGLNELDTLEANRFYEATRPWTGSYPAWSPDGESMAFVSSRTGWETIYIMNADGTEPRALLPDTNAYSYQPDWSPDGLRIAFVFESDGNPEIYVVNADGSGQTNLTNQLMEDYRPAWSPDGAKIAFTSARDGNDEIYVMNADGSGLTNLSNQPGSDFSPAWSPDGKRIAFVSDRDGNLEIYVMNADGSGQTNLTNQERDDYNRPAWSPDGARIAFGSERDGNGEIYVMNADGSSQTNLTNEPGEDLRPAWSPDGRLIAYSSERSGNEEVFVMQSDGADARSLSAVATEAAQAATPPPIPLAEYAAAVARPALVQVVLLIPLWSPYLYVRRHGQQAFSLAVGGVLSAVLIVGLSRGGLIGLWVFVNGALWVFGTVWGLRQIKRGDCWLMRRRGEVSELPRPWAAPKVLEAALAPAPPGPTLAPGAATAGQGERAATVEGLRLVFRTGSPEERQRAIEALKALGEIEEF